MSPHEGQGVLGLLASQPKLDSPPLYCNDSISFALPGCAANSFKCSDRYERHWHSAA